MSQAAAANEAVLPSPVEDNVKEEKKENESTTSLQQQPILDIGTLVRLEGLQTVSMNGKTGTVTKYENEKDPSSRRYRVALDDPNAIDSAYGKIVRIKAENLVPISFVESMTIQGFNIDYCTFTPSEAESTSTSSSSTKIKVFGGGSFNPSGHLVFLPRNANLPTRKFAFHNDICKKFFYKMYNEGDFVVAWRYVHAEGQTNLKKRHLEFRFGFEERHVRECFPKENEFEQLLSPVLQRGPFFIMLRVNVFTVPQPAAEGESSSPVGYDLSEVSIAAARAIENEFRIKGTIGNKKERVYLQVSPNQLVPEIWNGCVQELYHNRSYRLIHHVFRQHGAKFPLDLSDNILDIVSPFDTPNDFRSKGTEKKMLEYLDLMVCRVDVEASVLGFAYSDRLSSVGEALEALEQYDVAGRVYVWAAENFRDSTGLLSPSECYQNYMNGAIAYRRAEMIVQSEHYYVKALQWKYKLDGNRILIHDFNFVNLMKNMLSMYSFFAAAGNSSVVANIALKNNEVWYNCPIKGVLESLLQVAGFETGTMIIKNAAHKNSLKPHYRKPKAALAALSEAVQLGTVDDFRAKILSCMLDVMERRGQKFAVQFLYSQTLLSSQYSTARDSAKQVIQSNCTGLMQATTIRKCSFASCLNHEFRESSTSEEKELFMQCPCRTATYCSKVCQTADWKEHKKSCPVHLAKKQPK